MRPFATRAGGLAWVILAALALIGCRETAEAGKYFEISGRIFTFNYRVATAVYTITLRPLQPIQEGQVAVATFDDPAGGAPLIVEQKIWPKLDHVTIESPPLQCVVKDRPYQVSIVIGDADGVGLQTLETTITSNLDQSILPDRALVLGPVYERNPDLKPDGRLVEGKGEGTQCPKA